MSSHHFTLEKPVNSYEGDKRVFRQVFSIIDGRAFIDDGCNGLFEVTIESARDRWQRLIEKGYKRV